MSLDRPLEVGLIGYGLGGANFHAPWIATTPGMRLAAVMTSSAARADAVRTRYPGTAVVGTFEELLAIVPALDLIAISTPNATHYPLARAVLEAGRHVSVDKPFAPTAEQALELEVLAKRMGKSAFPFQNRRWDGDFLTVQHLLSEGTLGKIHRFESRFDRWRPTPKAGWCRPDAREAAEDILLDLATHLIDQALVLFGPVTDVFAEVNRIHPNVVTTDDAFIALTHANGVISHLYMTSTAGISEPRMSVYGSSGAYLKSGLDIQEDVLRAGGMPGSPGWGEETEAQWGTLGAGEKIEKVPTMPGSYAPFYAGVERTIRMGTPPPVSVADVAMGLSIIAAARRSAAEGRKVAP
ncbi:MAG: oxidoreductase domain protein [Gemmatimonadetes bacterium]|nr:oxidoreductase domain protein [Gemmatimonadota bacterium]